MLHTSFPTLTANYQHLTSQLYLQCCKCNFAVYCLHSCFYKETLKQVWLHSFCLFSSNNMWCFLNLSAAIFCANAHCGLPAVRLVFPSMPFTAGPELQ